MAINIRLIFLCRLHVQLVILDDIMPEILFIANIIYIQEKFNLISAINY